MKFVKYHLPVVVYMIIIFIASSLPEKKLPEIGFEMNDKIIHIGEYFLLYLLFFLSFSNIEKDNIISKNLFTFSFILTVFYGITDELHQALVPGRSADIFDIVADIFGALLGILFLKFYFRLLKPIFVKN